MSDVAPAPVVRPAPDPARDARVAARRADDARRAGRALDALLADRSANECSGLRCTCCGVLSDYLWRVRPSTCGACPDDCGSCTRDGSDCECYEHQGNYRE